MIEVSSSNIRDACDLVEKDAFTKNSLACVFQSDYGADFIVVRKNKTHAGNKQVRVPVAIDVGRFYMERCSHVAS